MHELPIVKEVLKTVLRHAEEQQATQVKTVILEIGEMHDLVPEWVEKFFKFASKGTIAEGAEIRIEQKPIICHCNKCKEHFVLRLRTSDDHACPVCGSEEFKLVTGREFMIKGVEIC